MSLKHRIQAHVELWGRYSRTFAHFWRHRTELGGEMLREDEAAFLPAALAVQEMPPSRTARWIARVLILLVITAFAWAVLGRMDIIVNAAGKVIPSERSKTIAAIETGSVVSLSVVEGQSVKAGDVLLQLDTAALDAERDRALGEKSEAVMTLARNQALLEAVQRGRPPALAPRDQLNHQYGIDLDAGRWHSASNHVHGQWQDYAAKRKKLSDDVANYAEALPLVTQQAASYKKLAATNDVSRDAWQDKEQARLQLQAQWQEAHNQREALTAEVSRQALDQIAEARRIASASTQEARRAASTSRLLTLKAPVDGTVQQLAVHTLGGVVPAAQPIMQIVPSQGPLEVEAFIENKDKGFVHAGQSAAVKVDTFEYTKYGTLPGKVIHVSQDAIPDEKRGLIYAVKVLLDETTLNVNGEPTPITPGMAVNIEIKTGDRRVIEYVMSPLIRHTREALRER
ncbi:MAG: HlyD family type I secretion periplasmic adaptor subunit [Diaphorobacter nitroreducens]|uniref:HlyD family type I secretion periplasmic adaptor subunit n=1 Tax=Diaphorobacter nitroreducens TaxID=164759 RepID=UPI003C7665F5